MMQNIPFQACSKRSILNHLSRFSDLKLDPETTVGLESIVLSFVDYDYDETTGHYSPNVTFEEYWIDPTKSRMYIDTPADKEPRLFPTHPVRFVERRDDPASSWQAIARAQGVAVCLPRSTCISSFKLVGGQSLIVGHPLNRSAILIEYLTGSSKAKIRDREIIEPVKYWAERGFIKEALIVEKFIAAAALNIPPTSLSKTIVVSRIAKQQTPQGMLKGTIFQ
ncbi:uncharacterized protein SAPINGB_P001584 [Magnusiomyces paraingens]|uniref:Uncharacterized protein n=1 Tax=Magnusiomyces paraingens TaxID=2606893 RepID=A0A5E8B733_9ASCO|nr:uncharacterized protein SAPINGB_P001584 [Saprochaete ingens]VVT47183.1 unnamed protein product [Saprochaete ingens]